MQAPTRTLTLAYTERFIPGELPQASQHQELSSDIPMPLAIDELATGVATDETGYGRPGIVQTHLLHNRPICAAEHHRPWQCLYLRPGTARAPLIAPCLRLRRASGLIRQFLR